MHIRELSLTLLKEFGEKYGRGDERDLFYDGCEYRGYELDATRKEVGFIGAIGFRSDSKHTMFVLWSGVPNGESRGNVAGPEVRLRIVAGPQYIGRWHEDEEKETAIADVGTLGLGRVNFENSSTRLVCEISLRACELVTAQDTVKSKYCEPAPHL